MEQRENHRGAIPAITAEYRFSLSKSLNAEIQRSPHEPISRNTALKQLFDSFLRAHFQMTLRNRFGQRVADFFFIANHDVSPGNQELTHVDLMT